MSFQGDFFKTDPGTISVSMLISVQYQMAGYFPDRFHTHTHTHTYIHT